MEIGGFQLQLGFTFRRYCFTDIQNAVFSLSGYLELEVHEVTDNKQKQYLDKEIAIIRTITESLKFVNNYQNLGFKRSAWQNVQESFVFGISHRSYAMWFQTTNFGKVKL
jgi:hypothetical protein